VTDPGKPTLEDDEILTEGAAEKPHTTFDDDSTDSDTGDDSDSTDADSDDV
jgi:hypothetical protein